MRQKPESKAECLWRVNRFYRWKIVINKIQSQDEVRHEK